MKFRKGLVIKFKTLEDFREFEEVYKNQVKGEWNYRTNPKYIKITEDGFCSWVEEDGFVKWRKIRELFIEEKKGTDHEE